MAELKTKKNEADVEKFLGAIPDEKKQRDCFVILKLMRQITGKDPKMWGSGIVGFGDYHYKYESGREGDWFLVGFSPRKQNISLYIMSGFDGQSDLMKKLGKYKTGKSCLYIKAYEDVDAEVLKELITRSIVHLKKRYS